MSEIIVNKPKKPRAKKIAIVEPLVIPGIPEPVIPVLQVKKPKVKKVVKSVEVPIETPLITPIVKQKRLPSAYNIFVKEHMAKDDIKALKPKERFGKISELYKASKSVESKV